MPEPDPTAEACEQLPCPRCGYDVRGTMGRTDSAMAATAVRVSCPECGLELNDSDVLGIGRAGPAWWVESHAPGVVGAVATARNALRSALAAHRPRMLWRHLKPGHARHPLRLALVVALPWLVLGLGLFVRGVWLDCGAQSPLLPFGVRLRNALLGGIDSSSFEAVPLGLRDDRAALALYGTPGVWSYVLAERHLVLTLFVVAMAIGSALAFALLPASRRRAGVQVGHMARATAVLLATAPLAMTAARAAFLTLRHPSIVMLQTIAAILVLFAWLWWWWWAAIDLYFGMTRPMAVATVVCLVGFLVGVASTMPWVMR